MINKDSSKVLNPDIPEYNDAAINQKVDNLLYNKSFDSSKLTKLESPKRKLTPVNETLRYMESLMEGPYSARNGAVSKVDVE